MPPWPATRLRTPWTFKSSHPHSQTPGGRGPVHARDDHTHSRWLQGSQLWRLDQDRLNALGSVVRAASPSEHLAVVALQQRRSMAHSWPIRLGEKVREPTLAQRLLHSRTGSADDIVSQWRENSVEVQSSHPQSQREPNREPSGSASVDLLYSCVLRSVRVSPNSLTTQARQ